MKQVVYNCMFANLTLIFFLNSLSRKPLVNRIQFGIKE